MFFDKGFCFSGRNVVYDDDVDVFGVILCVIKMVEVVVVGVFDMCGEID